MGIKHNRQVTAAEEASPEWEINRNEWNEDHVVDAGTIVNADIGDTANIAETKIARTQIRKSGIATITALTKSVTVTHGLGYTPTVVLPSPVSDLEGRRCWAPVADYGATTCKIYISSPCTHDLTVGYDAIYNIP